MRIGLNLLYLIPGVVGGTETYAVSFIRALAKVDSNNEYMLFLNHEASDLRFTDAPNFRTVVAPLRAVRRAVRYAWEQLVLPRQALAVHLDVLHSLAYVGPLFVRCAHVVTIYDLNYLAQQDTMPRVRRRALKFFIERLARRADHILTASEFSRREIMEHLLIPTERITVAHGAAGELARGNGGVSWRDIMCRYGIEEPFVMAFSSQSPHKNIPRLVQAFERVSHTVEHSLVLVGNLPEDGRVQTAINSTGVARRIRTTGFVPEEDLTVLLEHADLLVLPSLYEGFGLPVLEAQMAGVPVACSNAASLPEVAGEGAMLFDPRSVDEIAGALHRCLRDSAVRELLVQRGRVNVRRYSWERSARTALDVYRRCVDVQS